jgi:hypothetical protein
MSEMTEPKMIDSPQKSITRRRFIQRSDCGAAVSAANYRFLGSTVYGQGGSSDLAGGWNMLHVFMLHVT